MINEGEGVGGKDGGRGTMYTWMVEDSMGLCQSL